MHSVSRVVIREVSAFCGERLKGRIMTREKVVEAIRAASIQNRLSCDKAHELTAALGVSLKEIGAICNDLKIKITACQLGCF
jgi:hypothetical protein